MKNKLNKRTIKLSKTEISHEEITIQLILLDYSEKFLDKKVSKHIQFFVFLTDLKLRVKVLVRMFNEYV